MKILITGGAGFIGTKLAIKLAEQTHTVTVVDNLSAQIHGSSARFNRVLASAARCIRGDIRNREIMEGVIADQEIVIHLAAETGTGQSMYAIEQYASTNLVGTGMLLEYLLSRKARKLTKFVLASSRAVYGEGAYKCPIDGVVYAKTRAVELLKRGVFEPMCPNCGGRLEAVATPEDAPTNPTSFYGLTKKMQEEMLEMLTPTAGLSSCILRFQNVYGAGQSLKNPYTGILAVFTNLARQRKLISVFEDGLESRDFVHVDDVVLAITAAINSNWNGTKCVNVGSGKPTAVLDVAKRIVKYFGSQPGIVVTGEFRVGDIRHNFADVSRLQKEFGFYPEVTFEKGLLEFLQWAEKKPLVDIGFARTMQELKEKGLLGERKTGNR